MTNNSELPRRTQAEWYTNMRTTVAGRVSLCALTLTSLLGGCTTFDPQNNAGVERLTPTAVTAASFPAYDTPRIGDEIRLIDTRVIRELRRSQPYQDALSLTDAQRKALIIGGAIVGAYLITEWLEDNLPLPPGP